MQSDLKYEEVWELKPSWETKEEFKEIISLVPFQIIVEPLNKSYELKIEKGQSKTIEVNSGWNHIIYKLNKISKEQFENSSRAYKYFFVMKAYALILGDGNFEEGIKKFPKRTTP